MAHKAKSGKKRSGCMVRLMWMGGVLVVFLIIAGILWLLYGNAAAIGAGCCGSIILVGIAFLPWILKKVKEMNSDDDEEEEDEEEEEE